MSKTKKEKVAKNPNPNSNAELLENPSAIADRLFDTEKFIQKNRTLLIIVGSAVVLLIGGYFLYNYLQSQQEVEAQEQMVAAVYYMEADSVKRALKGDGNYQGFEAIAEDYPLSKAANLANFYKGVAYMKEGKFKQAIESLEKFSANDILIQARAYCLIGDANMELNKLSEAASYYRKAANYKPNEQFSPAYLMKLGLALELQKKNTEAIAVYDELVSKYPKSTELTNAKKCKARLESLSQK